ncbi:hypothetical protein VV02_07895 [Luteipulveratus mongoliensis]|uniref:NodB homology domain-containing protein n=1 Tax=Luteipulveratus mongoliensis TaxID=571913 RepID=A0A0K1JPV0_9MICO|nr:hypothetical protein VV02_07895 [Luteipulveratus mongoliensis]
MVWRGPAVGRGVALTFDDGPDPRWTPKVLERLAKHHVHATFFMLGRSVERYPDVARQVAEAGHEIGIHGWTHKDMTTIGLPDLTKIMKRTHAQISEATGRSPVLLRPPYGRFDAEVIYAATGFGYTIPLWSHSLPSKNSLSAATHNVEVASPGMIVLAHDARARASQDVVVAADWMIDRMQTSGYTFQTVTAMLDAGDRG